MENNFILGLMSPIHKTIFINFLMLYSEDIGDTLFKYTMNKSVHLTLCCHGYGGTPLIRPPLGNGKSGLIRGVASREGYIRYKYTPFVFKKKIKNKCSRYIIR